MVKKEHDLSAMLGLGEALHSDLLNGKSGIASSQFELENFSYEK